MGATPSADPSAETADAMPAIREQPARGLPTNTPRCPSCQMPMNAGAVLCVNCGFHLPTGKRIKPAGE